MAERARVTVFCGSALPADEALVVAARALGTFLGQAGIDLVYGGSRTGLMGACADAALAAGGRAFGVLPHRLSDREVAHESLTTLHLVETMAERKEQLLALGDAYVALPGGYGTLDEFFEALTMAQLGYHDRPCILVNLGGFYDGVVAYLDRAAQEGLVRAPHRPLCRVVVSIDALIEQLRPLA